MTSTTATFAPFRFEQLTNQNRDGFTCGQPDLDAYFQNRVTQDIKRRISNCFIAIEEATGQIAAFYTLAATSVVIDELPEETTKKLPRYKTLPAVLIGRLAVAASFQKRGLGSALLADAAQRAVDGDAAAFVLIVDSKDDQATTFYRHHGFIELESRPRTLFLPLATVKKTVAGNVVPPIAGDAPSELG